MIPLTLFLPADTVKAGDTIRIYGQNFHVTASIRFTTGGPVHLSCSPGEIVFEFRPSDRICVVEQGVGL